MKTAFKFLILATVITFLIFLNTLAYDKNPKNHPSPKSTRVIAPSAKNRTNPFPRLESQAQKLTNQQLRTAIKTEWSKLDQRPNNRELLTLISHLRELGRRDALDGIKFIETLPSLENQSDYLQAKIAIIAGWGLADLEAAGAYLYKGGVISSLTEPISNIRNPFEKPSPTPEYKALDDIEYEIQNRWINAEQGSFLAMISEVDRMRPFNTFRRKKIQDRFPQLPNRDLKEAKADPFETDPDAAPSITPRSETRYFKNFGGKRASSTLEWAARNPDLARLLLEPTRSDPNAPTSLIYAEDRPEIIGGLSLKNTDYQALLDLVPSDQRLITIAYLINLAKTHHTAEVWPVDGRPAPTQLSQSERADAIRSVIETHPSILQDTRSNYLEALEKSVARSRPTE